MERLDTALKPFWTTPEALIKAYEALETLRNALNRLETFLKSLEILLKRILRPGLFPKAPFKPSENLLI